MSVFPPPDKNLHFPTLEARWLEFWRENDIFSRQLDQSARRAADGGKGSFVFYEGPPTANGLPHPGHVLTRVVKDLFPRFRAMQGYDAQRKAGWDTHGLPVEIEVEKELGLEGKQQVERYGIEPFIKKCMNSVFRYANAWADLTARLGFWIDLDDPYVTYHKSYVESVWWSLKQFWEAGLLYHGHKIVPWCPRCGTALSSHEVGQGYREVADPSAYVAFQATDEPGLSFLAWTTTPWTLLSNVALAVGADFDYDFVRVGPQGSGDGDGGDGGKGGKDGEGETLVLASALRATVLAKFEHRVVKTVKGSDLVGREYRPLYDFAAVDKPAWRIVAGDFVGLDAGTGIVHIAPAFGEDDYRVGRDNDLPLVNLVKPDGCFDEAVTPWAGKFVKDADPLILKDLRSRGRLLKSETYKHDYPFCWRCPSPLLYYPRPAWYIRTSAYKDELLANNEQIAWYPEHIKHGRFGNFLESNVDWALSRERFWGTPLPIWKCACGHTDAVGGLDELRRRAADPGVFERMELENEHLALHKPYVDQVEIPCPKCSGLMRRVSEVIDCWYDSGAMPFAQWGYPHRPGSAGKLAAALPADFISEALDQTRGWFYSLLAIATMLKQCARLKSEKGEPLGELEPWAREYPLPYRRCLVLGLLLAQDGFKLSKSKRNYPDPDLVLAEEGADAMRWFFYSSNQPWTSTRFFQAGIREAQKDFLVRLRNVLSFFAIYADIDGFDPRGEPRGAGGARPDKTLSPESFAPMPGYVPAGRRSELDRWLVSKRENLTATVTRELENMNILGAAQALSEFVDQLSNWYVRRSRDRFWQSGNDESKATAYWTLYEALTRLSLLMAPFTPFFAEELYQNLVRAPWPEDGAVPLSVHLCHWPEADSGLVDGDVEKRMDLVREIASLGLAARASQKIKVRQPLARAVVVLREPALRDGVAALAEVVRDEINVNELVFADDAAEYVAFTVKPNFQRLGPRLGAAMKDFAKAVAALKAGDLVRALREDGRATIDGAVYETADFDVRIAAKEGFAAADGRGAVVVLDTNISPELERAGLAREIVNRVQNLRKDLDLPFQARIALRVGAGGRLARAAVEHAGLIAAETLAADFAVNDERLDHAVEVDIAGEPVRLSLRVL